jgi:hypothetical protein
MTGTQLLKEEQKEPLVRGSRSFKEDTRRYEKVPLNSGNVRYACNNAGERSGLS